MNILFINSGYPEPTVGGVERVTYDLGEELTRRGHQVDCLALCGALPSVTRGRMSCFQLPESGGWPTPTNSAHFKQFLLERQIQVVVVHSEREQATQLCEQALPDNVSRIFVLHTSPPTQRGGLDDCIGPLLMEQGLWRGLLKLPYRLAKWLRNTAGGREWEIQTLRRRYALCDAYVTLSEHYNPELQRIGGFEEHGKMVSIANPIAGSHEEKRNLGCARKRNWILWVGRMCFVPKRPDRMVRIWEKMSCRHPDWELHLLGDGEARPILESYCKKNKVQRIFFHGRSSPEEFYEKAKVLCLTSSWEGWPMVIGEAMRCGCVPVVYDSYAAVRSIITGGEDGIIVPAFDESRFISALEGLMNDSAGFLDMSDKVRQKVNQFQIEKIGGQWEALLEKVICRRKS